MMLRVWLFGVLVLRIERDDQPDTSPGDVTSTPVGFVGPWPDQRYQAAPGGDLE